MSNMAILVRLGITRGWRFRLLNTVKFYAASIAHCLFIYLLLRAKSFRIGLWVVAYFILCLLKKYVIHVFFWRLPGVTKVKYFNSRYGVRVLVQRNEITSPYRKVKVAVAPTKRYVSATRRNSAIPVNGSAESWSVGRKFLAFASFRGRKATMSAATKHFGVKRTEPVKLNAH